MVIDLVGECGMKGVRSPDFSFCWLLGGNAAGVALVTTVARELNCGWYGGRVCHDAVNSDRKGSLRRCYGDARPGLWVLQVILTAGM